MLTSILLVSKMHVYHIFRSKETDVPVAAMLSLSGFHSTDYDRAPWMLLL